MAADSFSTERGAIAVSTFGLTATQTLFNGLQTAGSSTSPRRRSMLHRHRSLVQVYDPIVHYQQVRDAWGGVRTPDGR